MRRPENRVKQYVPAPYFLFIKAKRGDREAIGEIIMSIEEFLLCRSRKGEQCTVYTSADVVHSGVYKGEQANKDGLFMVLQMDEKTKSIYKNIGTTSGDAVGDSISIPISDIVKIVFEG